MLKRTMFGVGVLLAGVFGTGVTLAQAAPPAATGGAVTGVRAVAVLKTSVSSHDAKIGQTVKAVLRKPVTLPNGLVLGRDAEIDGTVTKASKHSKAMPNGVLVLTFDQVREKGKPPVPVTAWIARLDPNGTAAGTEELAAVDRVKQEKDEEEAAKKAPMATGLPGVLLQVSREGSGTVFSLGGDVYLDRDAEITFLLNDKELAAAK